MKSLKIKGTKVLKKNLSAKAKIVINQGGSRSGKTIAILQLIIINALKSTGKVYTIVRKSFPSLRMTVLRDFINLLYELKLYDEDKHNKSEQVFSLNGNTIEFISLDSPMKKRGSKREYLFVNECNELDWESMFQLLIRTTERIYIDFNPSDEFHWIYDKLIPRDDAELIKSTYRDNPFLEQTLIDEIEMLQFTDANYYQIYGMGERGQAQSLVFSTFNVVEKVPDNAVHLSYGLDFGYSVDPTCLVRIWKHENNLYFDELIYERRLTNDDISDKFIALDIDNRDSIFADSSEPKSIEHLFRKKWNIKGAKKGKDSINFGIDTLRRYILNVTQKSVNLIKEFRTYKFETDKHGTILNKPIDKDNHGIDAIRYGCTMALKSANFGKYYIQ